jgi:hypothetical protein
MYEPETVRERAYIYSIASIYQTDSIVDSVVITGYKIRMRLRILLRLRF